MLSQAHRLVALPSLNLRAPLHWAAAVAVAASAFTALPAAAKAPEFVSVKNRVVNIRSQPNTRSEIRWELAQGYPMQVTGRNGQWLRVKDYEGTLGWVHRPLTAKAPHYVAKGRTNLRSGPGTQFRQVGQLDAAEIVQTLEKKSGWAKVRRANGQQGWMSQKLGWGW